MSVRVICHIDLNAFFASAMQLKFPHLIGKPVAVCTNSRGSVVTTASYEARAYGVTSAMPLVIAKQKCPQLEVVDTDFQWFGQLSNQFIELMKNFSPIVEQASIDECYVDLTDAIKQYDKPLNLVVEIQQTIFNKLGLKSSIGLAPNKFLAKMASDMKKPMGITVLRKREIAQKLWPLPIDEMHYIGKKSAQRLHEAGIHSIYDLAHSNLLDLIPLLGKQASVHHQRANGNDDEAVITNHDVKSISASQSLFEPIIEYTEVSYLLSSLVHDIALKCRKGNVMGKTLTLNIRQEDGSSLTKSSRHESGISKYDILFQEVLLLFDALDDQEPLKFVALTLTNLIDEQEDEIYNLFTLNKITKVDDIIKTSNSILGKNILIKANELRKK